MNCKNINRIIVHGNCPDGMASAMLLYDVLNVEPEFHVHNTYEFNNLKVTPNTLFCDICPPKHLVNDFVNAGGIVLDHHKYAEQYVKRFGNNGVFADEDSEPGVSGAVLAYREFALPFYKSIYKINPAHAERFAHLAGVRDTWQNSSDVWLESCYQAAALTFFSWKYWKSLLDSEFASCDDVFSIKDEMKQGKIIFERRLMMAQKLANDIYSKRICKKYNVAIFNDPDKLTSDVAEIVRNNGMNIIIGFFYTTIKNTPAIVYTLRSDGSFDVGKFCKSLGGGGHIKSAGYTKKAYSSDDPYHLVLNDLENYVK